MGKQDRPWGSGMECGIVTVPTLPHLFRRQAAKETGEEASVVSPEFVDEALCACEEHLNNLGTYGHRDKDVEALAPPEP